jgi:hypothetical protein
MGEDAPSAALALGAARGGSLYLCAVPPALPVDRGGWGSMGDDRDIPPRGIRLRWSRRGGADDQGDEKRAVRDDLAQCSLAGIHRHASPPYHSHSDVSRWDGWTRIGDSAPPGIYAVRRRADICTPTYRKLRCPMVATAVAADDSLPRDRGPLNVRPLALSVDAAARALSVSPWLVKARIREGRLAAFREGARVLISVQSLEAYVRERVAGDQRGGA